MKEKAEIIGNFLFIKGELVLNAKGVESISRSDYEGGCVHITCHDSGSYSMSSCYNIPDKEGDILPLVVEKFAEYKRKNNF